MGRLVSRLRVMRRKALLDLAGPCSERRRQPIARSNARPICRWNRIISWYGLPAFSARAKTVGCVSKRNSNNAAEILSVLRVARMGGADGAFWLDGTSVTWFSAKLKYLAPYSGGGVDQRRSVVSEIVKYGRRGRGEVLGEAEFPSRLSGRGSSRRLGWFPDGLLCRAVVESGREGVLAHSGGFTTLVATGTFKRQKWQTMMEICVICCTHVRINMDVHKQYMRRKMSCCERPYTDYMPPPAYSPQEAIWKTTVG